MVEAEQIKNQQNLLALHRDTLTKYLAQQARLGGEVHTPPHVLHGVEESRKHIRRIKGVLRGWGIDARDFPDDEMPSSRDTEPALLSPQDQARAGLQALASLMNTLKGMPGALAAMAVYQASFEGACLQINILNSHKMLHDLFQRLELDYAVVARHCKAPLADQAAWEMIEPHESALYSEAEGLLRFAAAVPFAAETVMWTPMLSRAQLETRQAFNDLDTDLFRKAVNRFKKVIDSQLSRTDASLKEAAKGLHLATLITALRKICDYLDGLRLEGSADPLQQQVGVFSHGVDALARLDEQLNAAITRHTNFQAFDDELRRVERLLEQDLNELIDAWQDIYPMMQVLCEGNEKLWATELMRLGTNLIQAIADAQPRQIRLTFRDYRHYATICFHQVDIDLLRFCSDLSSIGATLDGIARMMQSSE